MNARAMKRARGQSSVEFFLTMFAFLVMLFAIGDMIQIAHNWMAIQYASNRGIRQTKMMPTAMKTQEKASNIRSRIVQSAQSLGVVLQEDHITVTINGGTVNVETLQEVNVSPLTDVLLALGGDHSGTYHLRVREAVSNESL